MNWRSFVTLLNRMPPYKPPSYPGAPRSASDYLRQMERWRESIDGQGLWDHALASGLAANA